MPMGFASSPVDGQQHPPLPAVATHEFSAALGVWLPVGEGLAGSTPVTATLATANATDRVIAFRMVSSVDTPYQMALSTIKAYIDGAASVPDAFTDLMWDADPIAGGLRFRFPGGLPNNNGSAGISLQYSLNGGSTWNTFSGGVTLVDRDILGLPATLQNCRVRMVNAIGNGPDSDNKPRTPLAGTTTYVDFGEISGMSETVNGGGGFDYAGTAADGYARASDYSIADEANGGWKVQIGGASGSILPIVGLYTTNVSAGWDINVLALVYPPSGVGSTYVCTRGSTESYLDLTGGTVVTHQAGDWIRFRKTDEDVVIDVARSATPDTWIPLATANIPTATASYPKCTSFGAAGATFTQPQVVSV